jgi:hypothetical protein
MERGQKESHGEGHSTFSVALPDSPSRTPVGGSLFDPGPENQAAFLGVRVKFKRRGSVETAF